VLTVVLTVVLVVAAMVVAVVLTRIRIFRHHVYEEGRTETNDHCFIINDKFLPNYHKMSVPELMNKVIVCIRQPSIRPSSSEYANIAQDISV
jgi:predicted Holliday junction resolvase-like endonuclease